MEIAPRITSAVIAGILSPFCGRNALISLIPLSVLLGIATLWVFRKTSDQEAIRKVKSDLQAHLYEMRLFTDEPMLILQAQWRLFQANVRYIALMLVPAFVLIIPMVLVFAELECFYGHEPLQPGREAIVTVQMKSAEGGPAPVLRAPDGLVVNSPAVRVDGGHQFSWRIYALRPAAGDMQLVLPNETISKSVRAGFGPHYVSERRVSSVFDLLWYPSESLLPAGAVDWIELRYPTATVHALGLDLHWLVWLLVVSTASALVLKRQFRVWF